ncbi:MAG: amidohydrolase family protein [Synergistaceae bacterium]|nr:amidohydrolase family protein [Synergistaceae bacterium]MBQ6665850.1 amidohydrolase family protein [Synergistaceae bacterium]MBQ6982634.1 amidohydrolase family protein [Synergistaceae bacterium]
MYQILIRNGTVIDPANNIHDVLDLAIDGGKISAVDFDIDAEAVNEIDASGCIVVPGLIDHHAHVWPLAKIGIPAESVCFSSGVTTVVDAGSTGAMTFRQHKDFISKSKLTVKAYINVCSTGLDSLPHEMEDVDPSHYDEGAIRELFEEEGANLLGLKLRTSKEVVKDLGYEPLRQTVRLAEKLGLSVMVHCTNPPAEMSELLDCLREGDVITHMYMNKGSTILDKLGHVSKAAIEARERGVIFEAADARAHFGFSVAERAIREGFFPDILATDITKLSVYLRPTAFSMASQLAKYSMLGIPEDELFRLCTINPARHMKIDAGTLSVGSAADVAVFRREEFAQQFGDRPYSDETAQLRFGEYIYRPLMTVKNGEVVFRDIAF